MESADTPPESKKHPAPYPLVFMRFRPAWAYIDGIREFGRFFCQTTFGTQELADRACVVIQETLENAVKYSSISYSGLRFGALYAFSDEAGGFADNRLYSFGASYNAGPLSLGAGYFEANNPGSST